MSLLVLILVIIASAIAELYTYPLVRIFGHNAWAERTFGAGGTYIMWKLGGVIVIIGALFAYRYIG